MTYRPALAAPSFALASALVLAACSGDADEDAPQQRVDGTPEAALPGSVAEEPAEAATGELRRIPAPFRGTFARAPEHCAIANHNRMTVSGEAVNLFEIGGKASAIRRDGDALAVTYAQQVPEGPPETRVVYLALESGGEAMRVRLGDDEVVRYERCKASAGSGDGDGASASAAPTVPARFRGLYALDREACTSDYSYNPTFQNVMVRARDVAFFETGGPVTDVEVDGDAVAITLRETVGDSEETRAIYLALNGDGTARYRPGADAPVQTYVRCSG